MSGKQHQQRQQFVRRLRHEFLESRNLLSGSPWQNPMGCTDLNNDGMVSPSDALDAINAINSRMSGDLSGKVTAPTLSGSTGEYLDANGDGMLTPMDPLMVINRLNSHDHGPDQPD